MRGTGLGGGLWLALALAACNGSGGPDDGDDTGNDTASDSGDTNDDSDDTGADSDDTAIPSDTPVVALFPASPIPGRPVHCVVEADPTPPVAGALAYAFTWSIDGTTLAATTASIDGSVVVPDKSVGCTATATTGAWTSETGTATGTAGPLCGAVEVADVAMEAADFDGADLVGDRTYEMWLRPDDVSAYQSLLRKGGGEMEWALYIERGEITFAGDSWHIGQGSEPDCFDLEIPAPTAGEWHHLAITWQQSTSTATAWLDGREAGQCVGMASQGGGAGKVQVAGQWVPSWGPNPSYWTAFFDGALDEVRISTTVRYTSGFVPPGFFVDDANTAALWRFQSPLDTYPDASGNNRDLQAIDTILYQERGAVAAGSTACDVLDYDPANNRPSAPVVAVRPADGTIRRPTDDEDLRCAMTTPPLDPEADAVTTAYRWFVDDAVLTGQTGATLSASTTEIGDEVTCEVTVSDAGGAIPAVASDPTALVDTCAAVDFDGRTSARGPDNAYSVAWAYQPFTATGNALTIETWVKPRSTGGEQAFVAQNSIPFHLGKPDYYLGFLGGKLVWDTFPAYPSPSTSTTCWRLETAPPVLDEWHHVAGVIARDQSGAGTKRLFVDGEEVGSCAFTGMSEFGSWAGYRLMFGSYYHGGYSSGIAGYLDGAMAGVRMSDTARYTTDFVPPFTLESDADTLSLWRFDEGEYASTLVDSVGDHDAEVTRENPFGPATDPWIVDCP